MSLYGSTSTEICPKCKRPTRASLLARSFGIVGTKHTCPPLWKVAESSVSDDPDEQVGIYADSGHEAAEEFARRWWEDECPEDGESLEVTVVSDVSVRKYTVFAAWSISFRAIAEKDSP